LSSPTPSQPPARDRLFGTLALQLDFIDSDALQQGLNACQAGADKPLGQVLVDLGTLQHDAKSLLDALVQQHLEIHGGDPQKSLASLPPSRTAEQGPSVTDPSLDATLVKGPAERAAARLESTHHDHPVPPFSSPAGFPLPGNEPANLSGTLVRPPSAPPAPPPTVITGPPGTPAEPSLPSSAGRFTSLRPHARGGLGEVFVALDTELGRHVALKQIQSHHADHAASRARFLLEAEITGGLEHPGVVPVYGMGCHSDGRPYYAMRFIQGKSLQTAIAAFHAPQPHGAQPLGFQSVPFRKLLGQFIAVCQAMAYAQSRGVIHRDLKPANVMLGDFGETLVIDWGMAKVIGRPEVASTGAHQPLVTPSGSRSTATEMGSLMGTPAYMSPEQASGVPDQVGLPSDIYSLGATLYHLLTGQAALGGGNVDDLLDRLKKGDFPPPRQVKPDVPRALEAICLKAMALKPEDRYDSARALASEVEHYLADEPVSVYHEPITARLARWARWHRTLVTGLAVLLIAAVVALTLTTLLVSREQARTEQQRRLADANFQTALHAVDDMLTEVAEEQLAPEPRMEKKRRTLLAKARSYYQEFLEQRGSDPGLRKEAAKAHKRLGDISRLLGQYEQARSAYDQAITLLKQLVADHPDIPEYRSILAECYCNLGEVWRLTSHPSEASDAYELALQWQRPLVAEAPDIPAYQKELARTQYNRGILFSATLQPTKARTALAESVELLSRLADKYPQNATYRQHLARAYLNLGPVLQFMGQLDRAEPPYREAIRLQTELVKKDPLAPDYRYELGATYNNLGFLLLDMRPNRVAAMILPAPSYENLGPLLLNAFRYAEAEAAFHQALAHFEVLSRDFPSVPVYRKEVANTENNLAIVLAHDRNWTDAEKAWSRARELFAKLAAEYHEVPDYRGLQGLALGNLGWLALRQKDLPEVAANPARRKSLLTTARQRLERAMELERDALKANRDHPDFLRALSDQSGYLAETLLSLGEHAEAARVAEGLPGFLRTREGDYLRAAELLVECMAVAKKDSRLNDERRRTASDRYANQAVRLLRQGVDAGYRDAERLSRPPFHVLKERADLQALLAHMKALPPPAQK
jgi:serine/threonine-protein kinase